ncbi:MAG TPA: dihydrofolate reductase family protein [Gemmatimonadales bacterium]|nr:dihydrofolate reductase family protein [Gemmatimonadales bacterium]
MRRIVAFNNVSADGFYSGADGGLGWVIQDSELDRSIMADADRSAALGSGTDPGTILFGLRTYEQFESFWPHALDDSQTAPSPHGPGRSAEMRGMAIWINAAKKIVFSRTRQQVTWSNSTLVRTFDPREIEALKRQPGSDMLIFGSGSIASLLTRHGLIDEYQFVVNALLLGDGRSLLTGVPRSLRLTLLESKAFPTGNVLLRYGRASTA